MNAVVEPAPEIEELQQTVASLSAQTQKQEETIGQLKQQLDWFKKQLFGQKSEKRTALQSPDQSSLFDALSAPDTPEDQRPKETIHYTRTKGKKDREESVTDSGLRFDETVPVERIEIPSPELNGADADQYEVIGEKTLHRLAQRPGSYVVLEYTTSVVKPLRYLMEPLPMSAYWPGCWSINSSTTFPSTDSTSAWRRRGSNSAEPP